MKKSVVIILLLLVFSQIFASYSIGEAVEDISFEGMTWNQDGEIKIEEYSLSELIGEQKPVLIYFIDVTYQ